tara:strand:+ start:403 stop:684 length:282 start_codon:yes stop_codon:yes gene_type:complete
MKNINDLIKWLEDLEDYKQLKVETKIIIKLCKKIEEQQLITTDVGCSLPDKETMISEMHKIVKVNYKHNTEIEKANFRIGWQEHYLWLNNGNK